MQLESVLFFFSSSFLLLGGVLKSRSHSSGSSNIDCSTADDDESSWESNLPFPSTLKLAKFPLYITLHTRIVDDAHTHSFPPPIFFLSFVSFFFLHVRCVFSRRRVFFFFSSKLLPLNYLLCAGKPIEYMYDCCIITSAASGI